jgi:hypothetical protein
MSVTKAQLVGGVGISTVGDLSVYGGVNVSGVLTASSFVGGVTGDATGLTGTPDITVGNITATGNVSIAGTLTYEDVTNVDSVGIITARSGVRVTGGGVVINSSDLTVFGNVSATGITTSSSFVGNLTGTASTATAAATAYGLSGTPDISVNSVSINGTSVIDSSRNLNNISTFDSTVTSVYDSVTVTATGKTLVNREFCHVTAATQTINLPATPSAGWEVAINVGNFTDTVVGRNGQNIMGLAEDFTIDTAYITVNFLFVDATRGWRVF